MDVTYPRELIHLKPILFRKGFDISISKDRTPQDKASKKLLFVAIHCIGKDKSLCECVCAEIIYFHFH